MATKYIVFMKRKKETTSKCLIIYKKRVSAGPRFSSHRFFKKTIDIIGISDSALRRIIKNRDKNNESKPETEKIEAI